MTGGTKLAIDEHQDMSRTLDMEGYGTRGIVVLWYSLNSGRICSLHCLVFSANISTIS